MGKLRSLTRRAVRLGRCLSEIERGFGWAMDGERVRLAPPAIVRVTDSGARRASLVCARPLYQPAPVPPALTKGDSRQHVATFIGLVYVVSRFFVADGVHEIPPYRSLELCPDRRCWVAQRAMVGEFRGRRVGRLGCWCGLAHRIRVASSPSLCIHLDVAGFHARCMLSELNVH